MKKIGNGINKNTSDKQEANIEQRGGKQAEVDKQTKQQKQGRKKKTDINWM